MNIEELPRDIRNDIEDQSLEILEKIAGRIVVIGGWAVRAHLGPGHHRYTLDVDGVADPDTLAWLEGFFKSMDFHGQSRDWGIRCFKRYSPRVAVPGGVRAVVEEVDLRIEISGPRIRERHTDHYFEFDLGGYEMREIRYHGKDAGVMVRVPPLEHMAAVKLGLPVDYKHNHDAAMLLSLSDPEKVAAAILSNDDWGGMVLRRLPKLRGRITAPGRIENTLAIAAGLDLREHLRRLAYIEEAIRKERR